MKLAVKILALAGVPARVVHGIALKEQKARLPVVRWLEIHNRKWWQAIDPVTGAPGIPDNYLAWWRGPLSLARLTGGSDLHVILSVTREMEAANRLGIERGLSVALFPMVILTMTIERISNPQNDGSTGQGGREDRPGSPLFTCLAAASWKKMGHLGSRWVDHKKKGCVRQPISP